MILYTSNMFHPFWAIKFFTAQAQQSLMKEYEDCKSQDQDIQKTNKILHRFQIISRFDISKNIAFVMHLYTTTLSSDI